jgi:dTDP-4-dehydrorhamnose reductase
MERRQARVAAEAVRVLVVGASGQVGSAMMRVIPRLDPDAVVIGTYRSRPSAGLLQLDAANTRAVRDILADTRPDVILFPAAVPDVEWCETHEAEARQANLAPLRAVLAASRGPVIAFSSDYVFDGTSGPYAEDATRNPLSVYGHIKADVEDETLAAGGTIVRTTGVFGTELGTGRNFVVRLVASLRERKPQTVPIDQIATPTYSDDLAAATYRIALARGTGLWHVGGPEMLSRFDLALAVGEAFELDANVVRGVRTSELGQKARRPLVGGLRNTRYQQQFGVEPVRPVRDALREMRAAMTVTT